MSAIPTEDGSRSDLPSRCSWKTNIALLNICNQMVKDRVERFDCRTWTIPQVNKGESQQEEQNFEGLRAELIT